MRNDQQTGRSLAGWNTPSPTGKLCGGIAPSLRQCDDYRLSVFVEKLMGVHGLDNHVADIVCGAIFLRYDDFCALLLRDPRKRYETLRNHSFIAKVHHALGLANISEEEFIGFIDQVRRNFVKQNYAYVGYGMIGEVLGDQKAEVSSISLMGHMHSIDVRVSQLAGDYQRAELEKNLMEVNNRRDIERRFINLEENVKENNMLLKELILLAKKKPVLELKLDAVIEHFEIMSVQEEEEEGNVENTSGQIQMIVSNYNMALIYDKPNGVTMVNFFYSWFKYTWWIGIRQKAFTNPNGSRNDNYRSTFLNAISLICLFLPHGRLAELTSGSVNDAGIYANAKDALDQCQKFVNIQIDRAGNVDAEWTKKAKPSKIRANILVGPFHRTLMCVMKRFRTNPQPDIVWPEGLTMEGFEICCLSKIGQ